MTRFAPLSASGYIVIDTEGQSTIHVSPAAVPGKHRGTLVDVTFMNSNSAARDITLTCSATGTVAIFVLQGKDERHLSLWQPSGSTMSAVANGSDVMAGGFVREF